MIFFHNIGRRCYRSAFRQHLHLLTTQYHSHNYPWYMLSRFYHIVRSVPQLISPLICCLLWHIFLPPPIWWRHVPRFPWFPHCWCDLMGVLPLINQIATVLGILYSIQIAYIHPPFHWYPRLRHVSLPCILMIKWRVRQSIALHEFFSLSWVTQNSMIPCQF